MKPVPKGPADPPIKNSIGEQEYCGGEQLTFARGFMRANVSRYVLRFYADLGLSHLYEVAIYEKAAARVPPGRYTLLWNNASRKASRKVRSSEMERLSDAFYRERCALATGAAKLPSPPREEYVFELGEKRTTKHWVELWHPLIVLRQETRRDRRRAHGGPAPQRAGEHVRGRDQAARCNDRL